MTDRINIGATVDGTGAMVRPEVAVGNFYLFGKFNIDVATGSEGVSPYCLCAYAALATNIAGTYANGISGIGATFTITATGALSLDSVSPPAGSFVLLAGQTSAFQNGLYFVSNAGSVGVSPILIRCFAMNQPEQFKGIAVFVLYGTGNAGKTYGTLSVVTAVGTDAVAFTVISTGGSGGSLAVVTEATTARAAILTDINTEIDCTHNSGCTITIDNSVTWPVGGQIFARHSGNAQVVFANGTGTTFKTDVDSNKTRAKGAVIGMVHQGANLWAAVGDLEYKIAALAIQANATNALAVPLALAATADLQRLKVSNSTLVWEGEWVAAGGTANALTGTISTSGSFTLQDGMLIGIRAGAANTSTAPTFAANGGTARTITKFGNQALAASDIYGAGHEILLRYVSATPRWELLNPAATVSAFQSLTTTGTSGAATLAAGVLNIPNYATGGGGGGGTAVTQSIAVANSFTLGQVVYYGGGAYTLAQSNTSGAASEALGIVSATGNPFTLTTGYGSYVTGLSGLVAETLYYLDPAVAGGMTATEPNGVGQVSKPVFYALTTTTGYFVPMRGEIIQSGASALTVPLSSSLTSLGSTLTLADRSDRLTIAASNSTNAIVLTKNIIATPYTIEAKHSFNGVGLSSGNNLYLGVSISDGTKYENIISGWSAQNYIARVDTWNTLAVANFVGVLGSSQFIYPPCWVRMTNDGTTRRFYVSSEGETWIQIYSEAENTFLTATKCGLFGFCNTTNGVFAVPHFRIVSGILGDSA